MDFSKVKLVVSDMDGTLLNSDHQVSDQFFKIHKQLTAKNIHFVAASGRQYQSMVEKLKPIKNEITIIAENGAFGKQGDEILFSNKLQSETIVKTVTSLRKLENPHIVLCGMKAAYVELKDEEFVNTFSQFYTSFQVVDDLTKIEDDVFFKIAIHHDVCSETYILPHINHLSKDSKVIVSGKNWIDISNPDSNKGVAIKKLQERFGISKSETMVFGDYNNDLEMLKLADFSYAMKNAHPNVKAIANYETKSNDENGVELILEKVITY